LLVPVTDIHAYRETVEQFVRRLPELRAPKVSGSLPVFAKSYLTPFRLGLLRTSIASYKILERALGELPLPSFANVSSHSAMSVVWKSIESLGRLGLIVRVAQPCNAIHLLRHPYGYVASVLRGEARKSFETSERSSDDYGVFESLCDTPQAKSYGLTVETLRCMEDVERLAWRWAIFNEKAIDDTSGLPQCASVRYEDVCQDPIGESRGMLDFAGLAWSRQTEEFISRSISSDRKSYYSVFKDPLKSATKWRTELSANQITKINAAIRHTKAGRIYLSG